VNNLSFAGSVMFLNCVRYEMMQKAATNYKAFGWMLFMVYHAAFPLANKLIKSMDAIEYCTVAIFKPCNPISMQPYPGYTIIIITQLMSLEESCLVDPLPRFCLTFGTFTLSFLYL